MKTTAATSWLLNQKPPQPAKDGEERLWWGVIRQAAWDAAHEHQSLALDGAEFLYSTGEWICEKMFNVPTKITRREIVRLLKENWRVILPDGICS